MIYLEKRSAENLLRDALELSNGSATSNQSAKTDVFSNFNDNDYEADTAQTLAGMSGGRLGPYLLFA